MNNKYASRECVDTQNCSYDAMELNRPVWGEWRGELQLEIFSWLHYEKLEKHIVNTESSFNFYLHCKQ